MFTNKTTHFYTYTRIRIIILVSYLLTLVEGWGICSGDDLMCMGTGKHDCKSGTYTEYVSLQQQVTTTTSQNAIVSYLPTCS